MVKFSVTHQIACNVETYRSLYKSTAFNEALYQNALWFATIALVNQTESDTQIVRKSAGAPNANMPEPMKSFVGTTFGYVVDSQYDKTTNVWTLKWTPNANADVLKLQGTVKVVPVGTTAVDCTADITFEANVFGIGGAIEAFVQFQFTEGWKSGAVFTNKWLADGKALA